MKEQNQNPISGRAKQLYESFGARASRDDEYRDWAGYRAELTRFILNNTPPGGSLLILGAGKCSDLDLRKLAEHCGSITLSDYRSDTMEEAIRRYGLSPSEQLSMSATDYVGITDEDYLEYTKQLLTVMEKLCSQPGNSLEETAGPELNKLGETLERIYRDNESYRIDMGDRIYDNAVAAGVHSQLNNSFRGLFQYVHKDVRERCGEVRFAEELNTAVSRMTKKHTEKLVRRFNDAVFAAVRKGVIYGYEKHIIYTPDGADSPVIGTVDGARQAGEAIADLPVKARTGCLWPLSRRRGVKFEMDICYVNIKGGNNMVYVHLATGFEEVEALTIVDVLRRAEIDAETVSMTGEKMVVGTHGVPVQADLLFEDADYDSCEMIVLPGGMPGAANLDAHSGLADQIKAFAKAGDAGRKVAAICAAPMVLADCGILEGLDATIYPGMEEQLRGANPTGENVTISGNIITGKGPALAMEFALALVEVLKGAEVRRQVAEGLLFS